MIIIKLKGGLGNQMFQFALGFALRTKISTTLLLDNSIYDYDQQRNYELNCFNLECGIANEEIINAIQNPKLIIYKRILNKIFGTKFFKPINSIIIEKNYFFNSDIFEIKDDVYLDGYWQSEKYFSKYRDELLKLFKFNTKPNEYYSNLIQKISNENSVSIHIRRGDYISNVDANSFHGLCTLGYYYEAIELIKIKVENPLFIVVSDDISWCKENFNFDNFVFVENNMGYDYEDLRLMSLCNHNIIANSSFSWWSAWLNQNSEKIVISPKQWFLNEEYQNQTFDLIPDSWLKI